MRTNADDTGGVEDITDFAYVSARRVPEPATAALLLACLGMLGARRTALRAAAPVPRF